jgi:hypothetical protein
MDVLAHGLWSFQLFQKQKWQKWAMLVGIVPDLLSWFIFMLYNIFTQSFNWQDHDMSKLPDWIWTLYNISHSIFIWLLIFGAAWLIFRKVQWIILPAIIHILIDIPTHSRDFLPTPFLWPISGWHFPGISWGEQWFMILNYTCIALGLAYMWAFPHLVKRFKIYSKFRNHPSVRAKH